MSKIKQTTEEAVTQLKKLIAELKNLKKESSRTGNNSAKSLKKIEDTLNSINKKGKQTDTLFKNLKTSIDKNTKSQNANTAALRSNRIATNQLTSSIYKKIRAEKESNKESKKTNSNIKAITGSLTKLVGAFGLVAGFALFAKLLKQSYQLLKQLDSIDFAMQTLIKSTNQLTNSQNFLLDITESFGLEIVTTSERYLKFVAAAQQVGLSLFQTQKIFKSTSKAAAVLGLRTHELEGVYLALEQMLSKGKVTTEELRRQLGERLPGAMGIMASALDVTIPKLDEMLKKGEVLSSEALPKFAEALEDAYGIESVEKVNTLVAAQNRLSNSIKNLVNSISKGHPIFKQFFIDLQNVSSRIIKFYSLLLGTEEARTNNQIVERMKEIEMQMQKTSTFVVNARQKQGQRINQLDEKIAKQREEVEKQYNQKDIQREQQKLNELFRLRSDFRKKVRQENIKWAQDEIDNLIQENDIAKSGYEENLKIVEDLESKQKEANRWFSRKIFTQEQREALKTSKNALEDYRKEFIDTTARLNVFKNLIESTFEAPESPLNPKNKKKIKIDTSDLDLEISKIKKHIQELESILNRTDVPIQDRLNLSKELFQAQIRLIDTELEKQIRLSQKSNNKIEKANVDSEKNQLKIKREYGQRRIDLIQKFFSQELIDIQKNGRNQTNAELIALRENFQAIQNPTKKQLEKYQKEVAEINLKGNNFILKSQADFLSLWLNSLNIQGEERVELERKIQELLSKIRIEPGEEIVKTLQRDLELIRDFINQIASLSDAFSNRRIENINAEIKAEEEKYDRLIKLYEDDASKKEALEQQKQDTIEQLDRKRLREEQRQARIRKAAAVAEVAINTAVAVSKVWGQTGIFGIAAQIPVLLMGALQTATILAQPIPQYKEGADFIGKSHIGMINDGNEQEFIKRNNRILTTKTKNAIIKLEPHDRIYKDKEHMLRDNPNFNSMSNLFSIREEKTDYSVLAKEISKSIEKLKINNQVIIRQNNGLNYLKEKARFNG